MSNYVLFWGVETEGKRVKCLTFNNEIQMQVKQMQGKKVYSADSPPSAKPPPPP